jgi:hypothetical protein
VHALAQYLFGSVALRRAADEVCEPGFHLTCRDW